MLSISTLLSRHSDGLRNTKETLETSDFSQAISHGFATSPKSIPSKYFYDDEGSRLFSAITDQPEYYLTGCEQEILERNSGDIAAYMSSQSRDWDIYELGSGDGRKLSSFFEALDIEQLSVSYRPVDIAAEAMAALADNVKDLGIFSGSDKNQPWLVFEPVIADYMTDETWLEVRKGRRRLLLFLGSNIGNLTLLQAKTLIAHLRSLLRPGDLMLVGFDLKKDCDILIPAYSDAAGYTSAFNLNLLRRINRELGGHFDTKNFRHHATYNPATGTMESWLISRRRQRIAIDALQTYVNFQAWEAIFTERSQKFDFESMATIAAAGRFNVVESFLDQRGYYCDSLWIA